VLTPGTNKKLVPFASEVKISLDFAYDPSYTVYRISCGSTTTTDVFVVRGSPKEIFNPSNSSWDYSSVMAGPMESTMVS
jgi:hypothetical protein